MGKSKSNKSKEPSSNSSEKRDSSVIELTHGSIFTTLVLLVFGSAWAGIITYDGNFGPAAQSGYGMSAWMILLLASVGFVPCVLGSLLYLPQKIHIDNNSKTLTHSLVFLIFQSRSAHPFSNFERVRRESLKQRSTLKSHPHDLEYLIRYRVLLELKNGQQLFLMETLDGDKADDLAAKLSKWMSIPPV